MQFKRILTLALVAGLAALAAAPAHAEDMVPVPDVRGMSESQAREVIERAGLRLGPSDFADLATLQGEFGRTFAAGTVIQQSPPPSADDKPSWLARGREVWLRVAGGAGQPARRYIPPAQPASPRPPPVTTRPAPPRVPTSTTTYTSPRPVDSAWNGRVPPRPPPPYSVDGSVQPRTVIPAPQPYQPGRPIGTPVQPVAPVAPVAPVQPQLRVQAPTPTGCYTLSCERKENGWHVRANGGVGFWAGSDSGDMGFYGGVDLGYTMCNCVGIDAFYRYAGTQFDRMLPGGLLEDSGDFHTVGLKATFDKTFSDTSRWYWFAGLGAGYFKSRRFQVNDDGIAGFGEAGLGYMLSNAMRIRLGLNVHVMDTVTGRLDPANDNSSRLLWLIAPTLGFDLDF